MECMKLNHGLMEKKTHWPFVSHHQIHNRIDSNNVKSSVNWGYGFSKIISITLTQLFS